jgi:urease accessory protein
MQPSLCDPTQLGQLEGFTHQASLLIINETLDIDLFTTTVNGYLQQQTEIDFGISTIATHGIIVRILGFKAEQLLNDLKHIAALVHTFKIQA